MSQNATNHTFWIVWTERKWNEFLLFRLDWRQMIRNCAFIPDSQETTSHENNRASIHICFQWIGLIRMENRREMRHSHRLFPVSPIDICIAIFACSGFWLLTVARHTTQMLVCFFISSVCFFLVLLPLPHFQLRIKRTFRSGIHVPLKTNLSYASAWVTFFHCYLAFAGCCCCCCYYCCCCCCFFFLSRSLVFFMTMHIFLSGNKQNQWSGFSLVGPCALLSRIHSNRQNQDTCYKTMTWCFFYTEWTPCIGVNDRSLFIW